MAKMKKGLLFINLLSFASKNKGSFIHEFVLFVKVTGKSFPEALILASTNPQYDRRLFIELQVQYMKIPSSEHGENMLCT